jgi:hypothetical protein
MENIEILERLRGYDFFKGIDYTNEFEDRLEKFIIFAGRTRKFQLENGNELNYAIVKKMLNKKNILIKIDENSFYKYKLDEYAKVNIDSIKWRILDDLNIIFKDENIKFTFNKNSFSSNLKLFFEENQITEKVDREKKVPITKRLDKYKFPISVATQNSGIYEEYREKLEKFLIVVAKSNLFIVKETKEPITYHTVKYLLSKKGISYNVREEEFNSKSLTGISSYISNNLDILKNEMLEDLNIIFESKKIEFDFATNKDKYPVNKMQTDLILLRDYNFFKVKTGLKEEFEDRLGRLFAIAKNTKIIVYKTSKYDITKNELSYNNIVSLMKKKGLKFQMSEIKFGQSTTLGKTISENFDTMKYKILNDLNTIFKEENIVFELDESKEKEVIEESEVSKKKQTISERLEKYKIPLLSTGTFARYRENLEKFLMAVAKTHLFMKKKSKEPLTYPIIKELLSKKTLVMQTDKFEFSLKKLSTISPYIYDNLNKIQLMLLEDLNAIFDEEDIEFDFIEYVNKDEFIKSVKYQEKEEKDITSKEEENVKVENEVKNEKVDILIENSDGKSKLENFVERLRKYHFRNIRQGLDKEYTDRLEKLFILVGKSKRVLVKNTKQVVDYEVAVSLMKKKGLKFQATKKEYNNGGFPENLARKFETYKNNIIEDLNTLYENEEIEFCLVDDIYSDNVSEKITEKDTEKVIENKVKKNSNEEKISEENQKLKEELENLKQTMEEMKEMFKTIQTDNINQFEKVEFDIPDFIRDMECNDVLSIKANKEYFKKFKNFALYNNINIGRLVNYLFYYAMEELGKKK